MSKKTKIKPKWGVSVFHDGVIGPVQFRLRTGESIFFEYDEKTDYVDPLELDNWITSWTQPGQEFECAPTHLFGDKKHAKLFADGARAARKALINLLELSMTTKFDKEVE